MKVLCLYTEQTNNLQGLAEACLQLSPQVALGHHAVFVEVAACASLYSESAAIERVQQLAKDFELPIQIAVGPNIPLALAMSKYQVKDKWKLPIDALNELADPLAQTITLEKELQLLNSLGIYQLKDTERLHQKETLNRFRKEFFVALARLRHGYEKPWPYFKVEEKICEKTELNDEQRLTQLEPLLFVLRGLLSKISARLIGRSEQASQLKLQLEQEMYSTVKQKYRDFVVELSFPQHAVEALFKIFKLRLEEELNKQPFESYLVHAQITVTETVAQQIAQNNFFDQTEIEKENLRALISHLCEKLGPQKVFFAKPQANYIPEKNWQRQPEPEDYENLPYAKRPLRLLRSPVPIFYGPNRVRTALKEWKIKSLQGPEKLNTAWWDNIKPRDYFVLTTETGLKFWVYREEDCHYLHGYFD